MLPAVSEPDAAGAELKPIHQARRQGKVIEKIYSASKEGLYSALLRAVSELGYSISNTDSASGTISFNTGMSMRSWSGQNMTATVFPLGNGESKVVIGGKREQKGNPFGGGGGQLVDWGEKDKIAWALLDRLDKAVQEIPEPVTVETPDPAVITSGVASIGQELQRLADLKAQGLLTDDEFVAAKAKVLG